ncbi:Uncharacterised protein [Mycobacteroides abscessus subsp. abscessus]|nr:Uncharacterised protein [Mycobacteroides abscessus subsp. abscessus]
MGVDRGLPDLAPGTVRTTIGNLRPTLCPPMTTLLKYLSHLGTGFMSTGMTLRYAFGGLLARGSCPARSHRAGGSPAPRPRRH